MKKTQRMVVPIAALIAVAILFAFGDSPATEAADKVDSETMDVENFLSIKNLGNLFELTGSSVPDGLIKGDDGRWIRVEMVNGIRLKQPKLVRIWTNERAIFEFMGPKAKLELPEKITNKMKIYGFVSGRYRGVPTSAMEYLEVDEKMIKSSFVKPEKFSFIPELQIVDIKY